ncbi:hypothetical protein TYRP_007637 [Tyrophagus putrescentiae]|nr:hypothetical protein TYRP_007637 [Tyrophagus putrescentiae]
MKHSPHSLECSVIFAARFVVVNADKCAHLLRQLADVLHLTTPRVDALHRHLAPVAHLDVLRLLLIGLRRRCRSTVRESTQLIAHLKGHHRVAALLVLLRRYLVLGHARQVVTLDDVLILDAQLKAFRPGGRVVAQVLAVFALSQQGAGNVVE